MKKNVAIVSVLSYLLVQIAVERLSAHGMAGDRFFPATLAIDDPFVADELSLPTISTLKASANDETPAIRETDYSAEFSKRLSPNLGVSFGGTYKVLTGDDGSRSKGLD